MKLRRITARRYVDDDTGTHFEFLSDMTPEQAVEQVQMRLETMKHIEPDEYQGTLMTLSRLGRIPPKDRSKP